MRRNTRIAMLLALVAACFVSQTASQQNQLGKIIGNIRVVKGDFPAHPVLVSLEMRGSPIGSSYCDDQGRFGFYNLVANQYRVSVNDDAYEPAGETIELNPQTAPTNFIEIRLVPRSTTKKDLLSSRPGNSNPYLVDPAEYYRKFPKKTVKEFEKGVEADQRGAPDLAIEHYKNALSSSQDFYPAHNNLGSIYLSRQDFNSAHAHFEAAVKSSQSDAQGYFNLGNLFLLTQRYEDASQNIDEGLKRRPDSAFGHFLQGSLYSRTGRPELAEKSLLTALGLDPSMSQCHLQLVNLYLQQKRTSDAVAELESYLKAFPGTPYSPKARELLNRLQNEKPGVQR